MHEIEDRIEDAYQDAMDILVRALGREDAAWFSHVFAGVRDVTVAARTSRISARAVCHRERIIGVD
jgi:hypothetical protein